MIKELDSIKDLCSLKRGDQVRTADRFRLFTDDPSIGRKVGNNPYKGINWIGEFPMLDMVIVRSRYRVHKDAKYRDRWIDKEKGIFLYYLMMYHRNRSKAEIKYHFKENIALLKQKEHGYPILLMVDEPKLSGQEPMIRIEGRFKVIKICHDNPIHPGNDSVLLQRIDT